METAVVYDPKSAWLRAVIYFAACFLIGWWSGAAEIIFSQPVATIENLGSRGFMETIDGGIFLGSRKGGELTDGVLNRITLSQLVQRLGVGVGFYRVEMAYKANGDLKETQIGILSTHDCRHYCATDMARKGYTIKKLNDYIKLVDMKARWYAPAMGRFMCAIWDDGQTGVVGYYHGVICKNTQGVNFRTYYVFTSY